MYVYTVYIYIHTHTNLKFLLQRPRFMIGPSLKNRFRVRLQMSLRTIRASDRMAAKTLPELPSPHRFVL